MGADIFRIDRRARRLGSDADGIRQMFDAQRSGCAICEDAFGEFHDYRFCIDHDHDTGAVRGLLCMRCNSGIGFLRDSESVLLAAARYVAANRSSSAIGFA